MHLVLHLHIQVHQLIAHTKVVTFAQFQHPLACMDGLTQHAAGNQRLEIGMIDPHIRSDLDIEPESPMLS